jgi:hypothetical protein
MTAYLVVLWIYEGLGHTLLSRPALGGGRSAGLWFLAPAAVLAGLVAAFARVEISARRPHRENR